MPRQKWGTPGYFPWHLIFLGRSPDGTRTYEAGSCKAASEWAMDISARIGRDRVFVSLHHIFVMGGEYDQEEIRLLR